MKPRTDTSVATVSGRPSKDTTTKSKGLTVSTTSKIPTERKKQAVVATPGKGDSVVSYMPSFRDSAKTTDSTGTLSERIPESPVKMKAAKSAVPDTTRKKEVNITEGN